MDSYLLHIRELVLADRVALHKWSLVVDYIVKLSADQLRIEAMLQDHEYAAAVRESLLVWASNGEDQRPELLAVFRDQGLNDLADKIGSLKPITVSGSWFEVVEALPKFYGREQELSLIHKLLTETHNSESGAANVVCITGLGGVGKSSLARKYGFQFWRFGKVIWVNGESVSTIRGSFMRLAVRLGISLPAHVSNEELTEQVYARFQDNESLFVFDNVVEGDHLARFRPRALNPTARTPHVLVTCQRSDIATLPELEMKLGVFSAEEAAKFVRARLHKSVSEADASKLAEKLDNIPLALQHAVAYIADTYTEQDCACVAKYLTEFEKSEMGVLRNDARFGKEDHSLTTYASWKLALNRIKHESRGDSAIGLINVLAYLNPAGISTEFLDKVLDPQIVQQGLRLLEKFSLVTVEAGKLVSIHRLVQHTIRLHLSPAKSKLAARLLRALGGGAGKESEVRVIKGITGAIAAELCKHKVTELGRECMSHGLHVFPFQIKHQSLISGAAGLNYIFDICYALNLYGNFDDCVSVAEQSYVRYRSLYGEGHKYTIRLQWERADAHYFAGNYPTAMQLLHSILPRANSVFGPKNRFTFGVYSTLAAVQSKQGNHRKAVEIYESKIPEYILEHGETSTVLESKVRHGMALRELGQVDKAGALLQDVYEKRMQLFGENDPRTLFAKDELGLLFFVKGEFEDALKVWTEVYEVCKQAIGETHMNLVLVKENMEMARDRIEEAAVQLQ